MEAVTVPTPVPATVKASRAWRAWRWVKVWLQVLLFGEPLPRPPRATVWRVQQWHDGCGWVVYVSRGEIVLGIGYATTRPEACAMARIAVRKTVRRIRRDTTRARSGFVEQKRGDA
jgi:hypothetical protein